MDGGEGLRAAETGEVVVQDGEEGRGLQGYKSVAVRFFETEQQKMKLTK